MFSDTQMLKGILEGCILELLAKEAAYGYKIVEILVKSGFDVNIATVYPILIRLQKQAFLNIEKKTSQLGPDRKYYSLTPAGHQYLKDFKAAWQTIRDNVDTVLEVDEK